MEKGKDGREGKERREREKVRGINIGENA